MAGGEVRVPEGDPLAVVDPTNPTGSSKSWPICASITATQPVYVTENGGCFADTADRRPPPRPAS
jgi:hypothetical protein